MLSNIGNTYASCGDTGETENTYAGPSFTGASEKEDARASEN